MKIGITGSKFYTKKTKIKELMWKIKQTYDGDAEIISLGEEYGADRFVKKYATEFDLKYSEFIPRYKKWNNNCVEKPFLFNQKYSPKYFFINHSNFVKYCDDFVFFSDKIDKNEGKLLESIKKSEKNFVIVE